MSEMLPPRLGPYRILRLLGEGSSGRVYLAEQDEPRRRVALKVLCGSGLSAQARERFRREAELLARLEHPAIARVYAAGLIDTDLGPLPYLAMQYVQGRELLEASRARGMTLRAKIELMASLCHAVHYAHSRGIVHRDLKPANILVDEHGQPHILDFGIAHVAHERFATMTVAGQILGTIAYMSPEQLAGRDGCSDPRADVYALGIIAYQLISGRLPYPELSTATIIGALGIVRNAPPERLSKHLPQTRGDIETIVTTAMAHDLQRRYGSAGELASEFERYLQHRSIEARPPTAAYLLGLFMRRHRGISAAFGIAALALTVGSVVTTFYAISEMRARALAERHAEEFAAVNRFLNEMLVSADPAHARGRAVTVLETLDAARAQLPLDRSLSIPAKAALAATLSEVYVSLGDVSAGLDIARRTAGTSIDLLTTDNEAALRLQLAEANALQMSGQLKAADALLRRIVARPKVADEDPRLRIRAGLLYTNGLLYMGEQAQALEQLRALVDTSTRELGADDSLTLDATQGYTSLLFNSGKYDEAIAGFRALIQRETRALGNDHPTTLLTRMDYAERLRALGRLKEAENLIRPVITDRERVSGPHHYWTLLARYVLCNTLSQQGRSREVASMMADVVRGLRTSLGDSNADTLNAMYVQANIERDLGHYATAEQQYRSVIALRSHADAGTHPESLLPVNGLALTLIKAGRPAEAVSLLDAALPKADGRSEHNLIYGRLLGTHGYALLSLGQAAQARIELTRAQDIIGAALDARHPAMRGIAQHLAQAERALESPDADLRQIADARPEP
ncbi:serine/threonine-protein kinase [Solimonas marina]|uniref:Protein kinase n=1 Tax=Solimonas marina TaxID=2714601 RepID=A0A969WBQ1_9GAMM|nr:serine/threonine-protein kinase [Solimonas marina]NKF24012.1 protein kinase [Solimonas marina]